METTKRFESAVTKLYKAFHDGNLSAFNCAKCAVGSMCNGEWEWANVREITTGCNLIHTPNNNEYNLAISIISKTGYSPLEIIQIEEVFLKHFDHGNGFDKESQFKGLCAVIEYLCELDNIPNIMGYTSLFETENDAPKLTLEAVFV